MLSMEFLLQILFACPKCWRVVASGLATLCSTWFVVSLAVGRRFDRLEARSGLTLPSQVLDALPLARSGFELGLIGTAAVCCWVAVMALRVLERQY